MKFLIILCSVLLLTTSSFGLYIQNDLPMETSPGLCGVQDEIKSVIASLTPAGQALANAKLADLQHEIGPFLQNIYTQIKAANNSILIALRSAEGPKFDTFLNAIGFNNASKFTGDLIDLCLVQKDGIDTFATFSQKTQKLIEEIAKMYLENGMTQMNALIESLKKGVDNAITQMYKTEKKETMDNLMAYFTKLSSVLA